MGLELKTTRPEQDRLLGVTAELWAALSVPAGQVMPGTASTALGAPVRTGCRSGGHDHGCRLGRYARVESLLDARAFHFQRAFLLSLLGDSAEGLSISRMLLLEDTGYRIFASGSILISDSRRLDYEDMTVHRKGPWYVSSYCGIKSQNGASWKLPSRPWRQHPISPAHTVKFQEQRTLIIITIGGKMQSNFVSTFRTPDPYHHQRVFGEEDEKRLELLGLGLPVGGRRAACREKGKHSAASTSLLATAALKAWSLASHLLKILCISVWQSEVQNFQGVAGSLFH